MANKHSYSTGEAVLPLAYLIPISSFLKFLVFALLSPICFGQTLTPFISDGCSAFPDGTPAENNLWLTCCTQHDFDYWKGGTYAERLASDKALMDCVASLGEPAIGMVMMAGVRVGGSPFFPTDFRWGYGWPYPRLYGPLTGQEKQQTELFTPNTSKQNTGLEQ